MKYNVGMYGGEFNPLHLGHLNIILSAASMCKELYVVICWRKNSESIPKELRYRWIYNATKHLDNVKIILIEDKATSKEDYNKGSYWEDGAKDIKNAIGKKIDVVFCGSDYRDTNRFESLYNESQIYYFDRNDTNISSTLIRKNPYKYWEYIPNIVREYYTKKVLLVGGESTGKSVLTQNLALYYNTNFVSEYGRYTCALAGGEEYMTSDDLIENLLMQKVNVMSETKKSNKVLFVDTDATITKFYSMFLLNGNNEEQEKCNNLADSIINIDTWDLILFLEPTVDFIQDGTRNEEIKNNREKYSSQIKKLFDDRNIKYKVIGGDYLNRFNEAKRYVDEIIAVD